MKKLLNLLYIWGILICITAQAQELNPSIISPAGKHFKAGKANINYTVGQVSIGSILTQNTGFSQGFQYPYLLSPTDSSLVKYEIGKIAPQNVWQTTGLQFYVHSKKLGSKAALSVKVSRKTKGPLTFNAALGYFTFTPSSTDTSSFKVTFRAKLGSKVDSQVVAFAVQPYLPQEQAVFGLVNAQSLPDPTNKEYLIISDIPNSDDPTVKEYFNHAQRKTRTVSITGLEVVIADGHSNGLYTFNNNQNIKALNIYAERIIIKDGFILPQTEVTFYARELIFEGNSYINTTPIKPLTSQLGKTPGIYGVKAGTIKLRIKEFKSDPRIRFIQIGGDGQNGVTALAGNAGEGGDLYTTLDLQTYSDRSGGTGGSYNGNSALAPPVYKGSAGKYFKMTRQFIWLHPNYIRLVQKYADDAYYLGYSDFTLKKLLPYYNEIDRYSKSDEWSHLSNRQKLDMNQLNLEIPRLTTQIENQLDYFGNPVGWVPMLSFEVNAAAFRKEVNHAFNLLYLNYWITESAQSIQAKVNAFKTTQDEKINQLEDDKTIFNKIVLKIPKLEAEANRNVKDLETIQTELVKLEKELIERAKHSIEKQRKSNEWRKWVGTAGTIASFVPVPWVAAIGIGLTAISQIDTKDLNGAANQALIGKAATDVSNALKSKSDINKKASDWNAAYKSAFPLTEIKNLEAAQETFKKLKAVADPFINTGKVLYKIAKDQENISDQDVKAELSRIRAAEPRLAQINEKIKALHKRQQEVIAELKSSSENIQRLGNELSGGVLAIDALNRDVTAGSAALDQRALLYLDNMEKQALFRLKKYHYYMAKAFEYRTLQPYKGNLNLEPVYKSMRTIALTAKDHTLTSEQFNSFKSLYEDEISKIAASILDEFNSSSTSRSSTDYFSLTKEELKVLNEAGTIQLNLVERGMFFKDREDIRIVDLSLEQIIVKPENGKIGVNPKVEVILEYPNISKLKKNGQTYFFNNYNINSERPIEWAATYFLKSSKIEKTGPSTDFESLIKFLLGNDLGNNANAVIYSRPAAWADITLRKQDLDGGTAKLNIADLTFKLNYDFMRKSSNTSNIEVLASQDWMTPLFKVNQSDKNNRQDGRGNIHRTYDRNGRNLTIAAPRRYGKWKFSKWTDRFGNTISNLSSIDTLFQLNLNDDYVVKANYQLQEPKLSIPDTIYVPGISGKSTILVKNIGNVPMEWVASNSSSWISLIKKSGVVTSKSQQGILTFDFVQNSEKKPGYITVIAPDAADYRDTVWVVQDNTLAAKAGTKGSITSEQQNVADDALGLNLYPNPNDGDKLFVKLGGLQTQEQVNLSIYSAMGDMINHYKFNANKDGVLHKKLRFASKLAPGVYTVVLETQNGVVSKKVIISR